MVHVLNNIWRAAEVEKELHAKLNTTKTTRKPCDVEELPIAVLPGDGIGPEVMTQALKVWMPCATALRCASPPAITM